MNANPHPRNSNQYVCICTNRKKAIGVHYAFKSTTDLSRQRVWYDPSTSTTLKSRPTAIPLTSTHECQGPRTRDKRDGLSPEKAGLSLEEYLLMRRAVITSRGESSLYLTRPLSLRRCILRPSEVAIPAASCPRCCRIVRPSYSSGDT